jgi:uncharacterized protein (TIGR03435 family)
MSRREIIASLIAFAGCRAFAQSDSASPVLRFDVASVRPGNATVRAGSVQFLPGGQRLIVTNMPLSGLILMAWKLTERQLSAPKSFPFDKYDIEAETEHPVPQEELLLMLQNLLVDRFSLVMHRETKELPVYGLVPTKEGPKLRRSGDGISPSPFIVGGAADRGRLAMRHATVAEFAWALSRVSALRDRIVIDRTQIQGEYDFELTFTPDTTTLPDAGVGAPGPSAAEGDSILTAIPKQLGLKLVPQNASVVCFVIDHISKPTSN